MNHLQREAGSPMEIVPEPSGMLDLTHLVQEDDRPPPPGLTEEESPWWPSATHVHSSVLSISGPMSSATAWQSLVEELAEESQRSKDEALKSALICEAGRILIDWLGRREEGEALVRRSRSPLAERTLSNEETGADSLALELLRLEQSGEDEGLSPEERAAAWVELGLLCEERMPTRERALAAYRRALELVPDHPVAARLAAQACMLDAQREEASEHLRTIIAHTSSSEYRVALLLDLADLVEDPEERLIILEQARQAQPTEEAVLRRLSRALAAVGDWEHLAELYRDLSRLAEDPISASTASHLAFLTMLEAGGPVDDLIADLAKQRPDHPDALDMLAPLAEVALHVQRRIAAGASPAELPEAESVLERLAIVLDAPREQALVREQLARLRLDRLRRGLAPDERDETPRLGEADLELADQLESDLRFCLVHLPEHPWSQQALAELFELRRNIPALTLHLSEWARTNSAGPGRAAILRRLGALYERHRRDLPRAAEIYELAVAEDPDNPESLRALGRVYEKMRRWPQAVAALQRQAQQSEDTAERLAALRRIAVLAEHEVRDLDLAIASLEEVAKLDPDDLLSLYQLARLCRVGRRPTVLIAALEQLVQRVDDPVARTALLIELGEVQELHLKQRVRARGCYEQALALTPGYPPALSALARLYRDNGDLEELVKLLTPERDPPSDPAVLALKAGRICFEEMGDPERALALFETAYRSNPDLVPARELFLQLLTSSGRLAQAYDLLRAQDVPRSDALAADYHYRLGLLAEATARQVTEGNRGKEPSKYENEALQHYRAALLRQPNHGLAFERARRLLVAYHDIPNLVRLIEELLSHESEDAQAVLRVHLGRLYVARDMPAAARRAYEEALTHTPDDSIVRHEFEGLLRLLGDRKSLPALYLRAANDTPDTHLKATLLVEAAELLLSTGQAEDHELAGKAILEALQVDPGNPYAVRHLERLLSDPESPFVVKEAVSARAVRAQSDAERAIFYVESAELLERVGAWGQARRAYVAAKGALANLAPADLGLQRTGNENRRAQVATTGRTSVHVLLAEARDAAARAGRGDEAAIKRALKSVSEILARDPQHRDALGIARTLATRPEARDAVFALMAEAFPAVEEPELRYELGLFLGEATTGEQAVRYFQAASQARPKGRRALRGLVNAYRQMGDDLQAAAATERLLELFDPAEPSAIDLRMGIASFLSSNPQTLPRAIEHARVVLAARPNDPRAVAMMADLLERSGQRQEAARLLDRLVARERNRERLHDLFLRKAKLLADTPGGSTEALKSIERAAALSPGNRDTITMLVDQLAAAGQTSRVAAYVAPIRGALTANVARGAVSLRDLRLLAKVAASQHPDLAQIATQLLEALDPATEARPSTEPTRATPAGLRRVLDTTELRQSLYSAGEPPALHLLLQTLEGFVARMPRNFPGVSGMDSGPAPSAVEGTVLDQHGRMLAELLQLRPPRLASSSAHNVVLLVPEPISTVRLGANLWSQGDREAWCGLLSVATARHALGSGRTRSLVAADLDLLLAASFEVAGVFNPTTADPDPHKLRDLVTNLRNVLPHRQRQIVAETCQTLASHPFEAGMTAVAITATDLRFAALLSGQYTQCLAAACLLDGVVGGGTLKHRVSRSRLARDLLTHLLSDEFLSVLAIARSG